MSTSLSFASHLADQADNVTHQPENLLQLRINAATFNHAEKAVHETLKQRLFNAKHVMVLVLLVHVLVIVLLSQKLAVKQVVKPEAKPMLVSLMAPPAPELVTVIEQPKPVIKPVVKVKQVIKPLKEIPKEAPKIQVAEQEPESLKQEAVAEPQVVENPTAPVVEKKPVEDKIEPPQFGVAYLNNPAPNYPAISRRMTEEGRVLLRVLVSADGSAETVQLEKTSGFNRLDQAAIEAVKKWQFIPAKKAGHALSAYVLVPVKFSLN